MGKDTTPNPDSREPLLTRATATALAGAVVAFSAHYGLDLPAGPTTTILAVGLPLGLAVWARRKTWSGATVADLLTKPSQPKGRA